MALPPLQVVEAVGSAVAGLHNISRLIFDARKRWQIFFFEWKNGEQNVETKQLQENDSQNCLLKWVNYLKVIYVI